MASPNEDPDELPDEGGVEVEKSYGSTNLDGLFSKYTVLKHGVEQEGCFVLRPESDPAARRALETYRDETNNTRLQEDIDDWLRALENTDANEKTN